MGREKRKTRLNKGESGDFIGFGAFAAPAPSIDSNTSSNSRQVGSSLTLSPVYTGSESALTVLFQRIGQKRDATTKTKALRELQDYFADGSHPKKSQVDALSHFLYLYHSKLHYDNTAKVRASCLNCCRQACMRLPKAWKVLCEQQQPELLGMMLCARADTAADVRLAANQLAEAIQNFKEDHDLDLELAEGVWDYVKRILSYGKSKAMYEDLFQKKEISTFSTLSEQQKEDLEERFERIVGTTLGGIQLYMQQHPNKTPQGHNTFDNTKFLWKTLSSPKGPLRRHTYSLLATVCQKSAALIDQDKISKLISQSLSSEKEPSNIPTLLETLLSFVAHVPSDKRTATITLYTKPLAKMFKRGCYGATQWAPVVLPVIALLPQDEQPSVLTSVWEGRTHLVGVADSLKVVEAVAETATFLLLQKTHDLSVVIAQCWLKSIQGYLTMSNTTAGPAGMALKSLCRTLARDLNQLDQASHLKPESAICHMKEFFWQDGLMKIVLQKNVDNQHLSSLLTHLTANKESSDGKSLKSTTILHLSPVLKAKFKALLEQCQGASSRVPSLDIYELWSAILNHLPVNQILEPSKIEKFVVNDLLRWMVIHTSTLSEQVNEELAKQDFKLFRLCCSSISSPNDLWNSVLRELVAAKCDLQCLVVGLELLANNDGCTSINQVRSPVLEDLCIQVAKEAVEPHQFHPVDSMGEEEESDATDMLHEYHRVTTTFLQTCAGLGTIEEPLISNSTIQTWVDCACPDDILVTRDANPVLETLIGLTRMSGTLDDQTAHRSLLQTWRQGDSLWYEVVVPWLTDKEQLKVFVDSASNEIRILLKQITSMRDNRLSEMWSNRAVRLLNICRNTSKEALPAPSLSLVGMGDLDLWRKNEEMGAKSLVAQCLVKFIAQLDGAKDRWKVFSNSNTDPIELFIHILISLSEASTDALNAYSSQQRKDVCGSLLLEMGGKDMEFSFVERLIEKCTSIMVIRMSGSDTKKRLHREIAVLSQLVGLILSPIRPTSADQLVDTLELDQVLEGDNVWYITNPEEPSIREECTISKIHTDLPNEVYFTIKFQRDGLTQERQTIGDRLRAQSAASTPDKTSSDGTVAVQTVTGVDLSRRETLVKTIVNELVTPLSESWTQVEYELLNIVISQCGIFGQRGIGSLHYSIFKKLVDIQSSLRDYLGERSGETKPIVAMLWQLSLALGYGCNTFPSQWNLALIGFDPSDSISAIQSYFESNIDCDPTLERAAAVWLTVSASHLAAKEQRDEALCLLFRLAAGLFSRTSEEEGFHSDHFIALRAIMVAQLESHQVEIGESIIQDSEAEALREMVKAFATKWENHSITCPPQDSWSETNAQTWCSLPICASVIEASLNHRMQLIASASRQNIDHLVRALYVDSKRWYAMRFLDALVDERVPLHDDSENVVTESTTKRLRKWCEGLIEEEAEELEEDVETVAQWVPKEIMNELESLIETEAINIDDNAVCSILSCWLVFLRIVDAAASKDNMNRLALTSYVSKCRTVDKIFDLIVLYGNIGGDRKVKLDDILDLHEILRDNSSSAVSKLAALSAFRTVEVFPTLSKNWWEMLCPKFWSQAVREFVERKVSPEILRCELDRMKQTSSFGEMNVKGSLVSREIQATYLQDDFTLSVIIKVPLAFPFRRAEVDCSRTLGVPENRWKRWSLQITQMLNNQGGTLKDALMLWKENVDKEFEGIEPCPVCYSVLHVKTHKLPDMECKTCHNRFHHDCLTQWFRSSGKSACVLCQQPWSGTRVQ